MYFSSRVITTRLDAIIHCNTCPNRKIYQLPVLSDTIARYLKIGPHDADHNTLRALGKRTCSECSNGEKAGEDAFKLLERIRRVDVEILQIRSRIMARLVNDRLTCIGDPETGALLDDYSMAVAEDMEHFLEQSSFGGVRRAMVEQRASDYTDTYCAQCKAVPPLHRAMVEETYEYFDRLDNAMAAGPIARPEEPQVVFAEGSQQIIQRAMADPAYIRLREIDTIGDRALLELAAKRFIMDCRTLAALGMNIFVDRLIGADEQSGGAAWTLLENEVVERLRRLAIPGNVLGFEVAVKLMRYAAELNSNGPQHVKSEAVEELMRLYERYAVSGTEALIVPETGPGMITQLHCLKRNLGAAIIAYQETPDYWQLLRGTRRIERAKIEAEVRTRLAAIPSAAMSEGERFMCTYLNHNKPFSL